MYYKIAPDERESKIPKIIVILSLDPGIVSGTLSTVTIATLQVIQFFVVDLVVSELLFQFAFCHFFHDSLFFGFINYGLIDLICYPVIISK